MYAREALTRSTRRVRLVVGLGRSEPRARERSPFIEAFLVGRGEKSARIRLVAHRLAERLGEVVEGGSARAERKKAQYYCRIIVHIQSCGL